jgi:hypothetical protein
VTECVGAGAGALQLLRQPAGGRHAHPARDHYGQHRFCQPDHQHRRRLPSLHGHARSGAEGDRSASTSVRASSTKRARCRPSLTSTTGSTSPCRTAAPLSSRWPTASTRLQRVRLLQRRLLPALDHAPAAEDRLDHGAAGRRGGPYAAARSDAPFAEVELRRSVNGGCFQFVNSQRTDAAGMLRFELDSSGLRIEVGDFELTARADEFQFTTLMFSVGAGENRALGDMGLVPRPILFSTTPRRSSPVRRSVS